METTAQRNSRIAQDDSAAHSAFNHAKDFFNGLATYEIKPSHGDTYLVYQRTPSGQVCSSANSYEEAQKKVEYWKNSEVCVGYGKWIL